MRFCRNRSRSVARRWMLAALVLFVSWNGTAGRAANVILMIGDGMGPEQIKAGSDFLHGAPHLSFFETAPYQSTMTTGAADNAITDSAASGTAMATGRKVNNTVIALAIPGDGGPLETIVETSRMRYRRTGLVTTSYLVDATPAAFGAHTNNRYDYKTIASGYLTRSRPDILMGGGHTALSPAAAAQAGYTVVQNRAELLALDAATPRVAGLFGATSLPYVFDGRGELPSLIEMTSKTLELIASGPDEFFLMIEAGLIDHAGHANDIERLVREQAEFEETVRMVVGWSEAEGNTLVVATADHETGGLRVTTHRAAGNAPGVTWSSTWHTSAPVRVFGWGPMAERVLQVRDIPDIHALLEAGFESGAGEEWLSAP